MAGSADKNNSLVSHYRPREILKNKVDNRMVQPKEKITKVQEDQERVFATEPEKINPLKGRKKIFI